MSSVIDRTKLSQSGCDFIDDEHLHGLLNRRADTAEVRDIIAKSMAKQPLAVEETAVLLAADQPELLDEIFDAARQLKRDVYGNRIVIFAPLYIGNECNNDCQYCDFRHSNKQVVRRTLDEDEIRTQVLALENKGHKRLILVFGDHPQYDAEFMAECVQHVYGTASRHGEIRRVSINAAPLDHQGYAIINAAGIATYQIFQETYHHETYRCVHPPNTRKADYLWRLDGVARAIEAECDDVGIGALFGLYDWRFEVLGLVSHALHLQKHYNIGPHTISFPRLRPASGVKLGDKYLVSDENFKRLVAILRLSRALYGHGADGPRAARRSAAKSWPWAFRKSTPARASNWADTPNWAIRRSSNASNSNWATSGRWTWCSGNYWLTATFPVFAPPAIGWAGPANSSWNFPSRALFKISARPTP